MNKWLQKHISLFIQMYFFGINLTPVYAKENPHFKVLEDGNNIIVDSPYGRKVFFAPIGFASISNYSIEIPLHAFTEKKINPSVNPEIEHNFSVNTETLLQQGNDAYLEKNFKESLRLVEAVLERNPNNIRALMMQGSLYHVMGNKKLAKKSWEKASELDPANPEITKVLEAY